MITIGPLLFTPERFALLCALVVFLIATALLGRRAEGGFGRWANLALLAGLVGGRLGHVALHAAAFADEPARIFAVWQGGFSAWFAAAAVAAVSAATLRSWRAAGRAALALGCGLFAWNLAGNLASLAPAPAPLPATTLQSLDGGPSSAIHGDGRPMVVNLWASWCPPCRDEMPLLARVSNSRSDVAFIFVNQGESAEMVKAYLGRARLNLGRVVLDPSRELARHYNLPGIPVTLFIGADGRVRATHVGEISPEDLEEGIDELKKG